MSVIEINELHKTYRDGFFRRRRVEALQGVSFSISEREIFGLLGPNGAGKTTLIKILLGIVRKSRGNAQVLGQPAGNREIRRHIGYLPENHRFPLHLTGNTVMEYYGGLSKLSGREIRDRRQRLLEMVNLQDWGDTSVRKYSKGMLQRLGLAQAMLHDPQLLVLDEPTDGVDPVGRAEIRKVLRRLKDEGKTIFLNSHLLQEVELVSDRVAILDHGQVRQVAGVEELTAGKKNAPLECRVLAQEEEIAAVLAQQDVTDTAFVASGAEGAVARFSVRDQQHVDTIIDAIRTAGISILSIGRTKSSLEEVFIEVVERARQQ